MMYTIDQVCEMFYVSKRTLMTWIKEGKVHPVKFGRKWLFNQEEIDRMKREGVQ